MAKQSQSTAAKADKPKSDPKVRLTNSQRRHLSALAKAGAKGIKPATQMATQPYEHFRANGLATKEGDVYKITDAGKVRAKDVDPQKYALKAKPKAPASSSSSKPAGKPAAARVRKPAAKRDDPAPAEGASSDHPVAA